MLRNQMPCRVVLPLAFDTAGNARPRRMNIFAILRIALNLGRSVHNSRLQPLEEHYSRLPDFAAWIIASST
jgi:hypothetical protein